MPFNFTVHVYLACFLGIAIVIGGQQFSWNAGLEAGFYTTLFTVLFIGSGYYCMCLCLSELTSMLPFSGGAYGFLQSSAKSIFRIHDGML